MAIGTGRFATSLKSGMVSVSPIPNMMIIRKYVMKLVSGRNGPGATNASTEPSRIKAGNAATAMAAERSSCVLMANSYSLCGMKFRITEYG